MRDTRLRDSVGHAAGRVFRQMNRAHNRALKAVGLSSMHTQVLVVLWSRGPITIGALQAELAMGSSTLTGAIDRMEKLELVRRVPVPGDRRAFHLEPANWKKKRRDEVMRVLEDTEQECFGALTKAEQRELRRLLNKASAAMGTDA